MVPESARDQIQIVESKKSTELALSVNCQKVINAKLGIREETPWNMDPLLTNPLSYSKGQSIPSPQVPHNSTPSVSIKTPKGIQPRRNVCKHNNSTQQYYPLLLPPGHPPPWPWNKNRKKIKKNESKTNTHPLPHPPSKPSVSEPRCVLASHRATFALSYHYIYAFVVSFHPDLYHNPLWHQP